MPKEDTDDVYYRFGGAAIATMLKIRYDKIRSSSCADNDQVATEIAILQKFNVHLQEEKVHIPAYLKYRNEGYMYIPCSEMLPLLKAVDIKTKEHANNDSFIELGTDLLKTVADTLESSTEILTMFSEILLAKSPEAITLPFTKLNGISMKLVRKLCHTRIQEFLDSYKQSAVSKQGAATLKGLNLSDILLGHHVNLKNHHQ